MTLDNLNFSQCGILIVDDEEAILDVFCQFFKIKGYEKLFTAENGADAVDILKREGDNIYLVISDMAMPEKDGIGLMTQMFRICTMPTALVFYSGKINGFFFKARYKFSKQNVFVVDYYEKPGDMRKLVDSVPQHLALTLIKREECPQGIPTESAEATGAQINSSGPVNPNPAAPPLKPSENTRPSSLESYLKHAILLLILAILIYLVFSLKSFSSLNPAILPPNGQNSTNNRTEPPSEISPEMLEQLKRSRP